MEVEERRTEGLSGRAGESDRESESEDMDSGEEAIRIVNSLLGSLLPFVLLGGPKFLCLCNARLSAEFEFRHPVGISHCM
jgi:hypothetical protein